MANDDINSQNKEVTLDNTINIDVWLVTDKPTHTPTLNLTVEGYNTLEKLRLEKQLV